MSSHLGVDQTLERLERLKTGVSEGAAREEKLNQEFRSRGATLRLRRDEALAEQTRRLEADLAQAEASYQAARQAAEARDARRRAALDQAHQACQQRVQAEIEAKEGQAQYKLQAEALQSKRNREEGLATAERHYVEFRGQLAQDLQTLMALEAAAQDAFRGYKAFVRLLAATAESPAPSFSGEDHQLAAELRELLDRIRADLERFERFPLPAFFKHPLLGVFLLVCPIPLVPLLRYFNVPSVTYAHAGVAVGSLLVLGVLLYFLGKRRGQPVATAIAQALARARHLHQACGVESEARYRRENERIENEYQTRMRRREEEWEQTMEEAAQMRASRPQRLEAKAQRARARHSQRHEAALARLEQAHAEVVQRLRGAAETRLAELNRLAAENEAKLQAEHQARLQTLESDWKSKIEPLYQDIQAAQADACELFPPWDAGGWENWMPPTALAQAAALGHLEVDVAKLAGAVPQDKRLGLPGPAAFSLPLLLTYPRQGSLLIETAQAGRDEAIAALNNIVLRLLSTAPPGRLSFTLVDPVGLGQSFSTVMHLADYAEHVINSRIWTQAPQIEQRLADLNEHMEKVIQMYLRNEYATIAEYNEQAGNIAEKYHFFVVADFPVNFSDLAARRLLSIASSGARCGVFTLIHWDQRLPRPMDFVPAELRKSSVCLAVKGSEFALAGQPLPGARVVLAAPPPPEVATTFIHKVGRLNVDSNRVEVPFSHVAPSEAELWTLDTTAELRVPIGRTGATKFQYLAIGKETRQHALVAGKTGSGKSTLFHVIITNLSLWCGPDQVEFYLVDFKKGVEFKCYATRRLPQARVVAIESDREFGLSVLQRVDDELKRRGEFFRKLGVQDLPGYKRAGGTEPLPRSLLIIDEFQEFFVEDDRIAQTASLLLDRIVRQGRAFGIHVLLGSQTLGGAYTVARTTLGQMVIRVALQCNEADAYLIMDDNNPAPRLLSRPGEAIYNDTTGTIEGNSPFQVVWLPDHLRDSCLTQVRARADQTPGAFSGPIVFEGNAPADVRENALLRALLETKPVAPPSSARIWLGAPNSIKGPTEAVFHRQSGHNLLLAGQREEAVLSIFSLGLLALTAQYPPGTARFILLDASPPDSPPRAYLDRVLSALSPRITVAKPGDLPDLMGGLAADMKGRSGDEPPAHAPPTFLFIHALQRFSKLRHEEDFSFSSDAGAAPNPAACLNDLICEGPRLGFHVIATCDTCNNVNRFLSRKALSEFGLRVLFQMSANDSASLIDTPKASTLGLYGALLFNEQEAHLETFRPYALPSPEWMEQAGTKVPK